jgi:hypothetical protein
VCLPSSFVRQAASHFHLGAAAEGCCEPEAGGLAGGLPASLRRLPGFSLTQIQKVPSDSTGSISSSRYTRPGRGIRERREVGPSLPAAGFRRAADRCWGAHPLSHPGRSLLLDAAFHSSAAIPVSRTATAAALNAPGLHLRIDLQFAPDPFGIPLPPPAAFCWPPGYVPREHPLPETP